MNGLEAEGVRRLSRHPFSASGHPTIFLLYIFSQRILENSDSRKQLDWADTQSLVAGRIEGPGMSRSCRPSLLEGLARSVDKGLADG